MWTSNNEKAMTDSVYTVQDCQTCFSVQPTQKIENSVLGPQMTKLSTVPSSLFTAKSYGLWIIHTVNDWLLLNIGSLVGS